MQSQSQSVTAFVKGDPNEWIEQWKQENPDLHVNQISIDGNRVVLRYSKRFHDIKKEGDL